MKNYIHMHIYYLPEKSTLGSYTFESMPIYLLLMNFSTLLSKSNVHYCTGIGYGLAATSIVTHNIYLFYPSIALIAFGNGSVYTPPVQVMLDWFPDR